MAALGTVLGPEYCRPMLVMVFMAFIAVVMVGGYYFNRSGPGDHVRNPNVKQRRNNWVP